MKQTKKLTRSIKIELDRLGYNPAEWRLLSSAGKYTVLVHGRTGERKELE